jgi:SAM-dependent methyltransferase
MPNDEEEQTRMQMLNGIYYTLLGRRLTTVPLVEPKKILDIGTGTGEWAMAMGEEYQDAEIIGTDIAKIQPTSAPPNVFFELDDAEEESGWAWGNDEFDLIHFRYLGGAFTSWDHVYKEAFKHIKPGGWIEVLDFDDHSPFMEYLSEHTSFPAWVSAFMEGCRQSGRPRGVFHLEPERLEGLGFVDVKSTVIDIPVGAWVEGEEVQKTGQHILVTVLLGMEAVCLRPLTEQMGWTADAVRETCESVAQELWKLALDPVKSHGFTLNLKILSGRKPGSSESAASQDMTGGASTESTTGESSASGEQAAQ